LHGFRGTVTTFMVEREEKGVGGGKGGKEG